MSAGSGPVPRPNVGSYLQYLRFGAGLLIVGSAFGSGYLLRTVDLTKPLGDLQLSDLIHAIVLIIALLATCAFVGAALRQLKAVRQRAVAEQQSLEREEQLRAVFQNLPSAACVLSSTQQVVLANEHFLKLFSKKTSLHLLAHTAFEVSTPSGERYTTDQLPWQRALRLGELVHDENMVVSLKGIRSTWLSVSAAPIFDHKRASSSVVIIFRDVTSRRSLEQANASALGGIIDAQESERLRIARELHDELGQDLTALSIGLKGLEVSAIGVETRGVVAGLRRAVDMLSIHVRAITTQLRPLVLADFGLRRALEDLAEAWGSRLDIRVDMHLDDVPDYLPEATELVAYRVVQEALTNIAKHANANSISLAAHLKDGRLRLVVEDDGLGFAPSARSGTTRRQYGLKGISERLLTIGGTLEVESHPGAGTTLFVNLPLIHEAASEQNGSSLYH